MLYAVLCYNEEKAVSAWTAEEDAACMQRLGLVQDAMSAKGKLGPVVRLHNTTTAKTLRKSNGAPVVIDGPFAETKEQLLGLYVVDCESRDAAVQIARDLQAANPTAVYEIRQIPYYLPGAAVRT